MITRIVERFIGSQVLRSDRIEYARPADFGIDAEEAEIPRVSGGRRSASRLGSLRLGSPLLGALRLRGPAGAPRVLFCPGNSGNLSSHLPYVEILHRAGLDVLAFDYSGFGRSSGPPRLGNLLEDARAALEFLLADGGPAPVGVFGVSLGAGVAIELAARRPEVRAAAVEGLFIHREAVRGILTGGLMGPRRVRAIRDGGERMDRAAHSLSGGLRLPGPIAAPVAALAEITYPFAGKDPRRAARAFAGRPLFIIHGAEDRLLPFEAALDVRQAHGGPGRLWLIPGVGHAQEPALACAEEYASQLGDFFRSALGSEGPSRGAADAAGAAHAAGAAAPCLAFESRHEDGRWRLQLDLRGPPGPYLASVVAGDELIFHRLWVEERAGADAAALATFDLPAPAAEVHALRYIGAERSGASWKPARSERTECFARIGESFRRISSAIIERRAGDADRELARIEREALPPAFALIRKLHQARRAALGAALMLSFAIAGASAGCPGCAARPSPFSPLGPLSPAEKLAVFEERTAAVRSLSALLRVSIDSGELSGAFDVACHYRRPASLRLSAFKGVLISTRPIFDVAFDGGRYSLLIHEEENPRFAEGPLDRFAADEPRLAQLYHLREMLFLPGAGADEVRIADPGGPGRPGRAEAASRDGGNLAWSFDPSTLEVREARIDPPGAARAIRIRYSDWRREGDAFLPGDVTAEEEGGGFRMRCLLRELEVNAEPDGELFRLAPPQG